MLFQKGKVLLAAVAAVAVVVLGLIVVLSLEGPGSGDSVTEGDVPTASPAPPQSAKDSAGVRFTAAGDYAAGDEAQAVFGQIAELNPDLHLALGDFSYGETDSERQWCSMVTDAVGADFPFQLLAGNHESDGKDGHIDEFTTCLPNRLPGVQGVYGRQWYVDVPQDDPLVRLVLISPGLDFDDQTLTYDTGTPEYDWTAEAIDGARAASIPWVVVGMHNPCLSVGVYGCDSGEDVHDLLLSKEVDLALSAHEHMYSRTHQLALGPGCPEIEPHEFSAACIADDDARLAQGAGTVEVTVGTGGRPLRDVDSEDAEEDYFAVASGKDRNPSYGTLDVQVTEQALTGHFRPAIGDFTDAFTMSRDG